MRSSPKEAVDPENAAAIAAGYKSVYHQRGAEKRQQRAAEERQQRAAQFQRQAVRQLGRQRDDRQRAAEQHQERYDNELMRGIQRELRGSGITAEWGD